MADVVFKKHCKLLSFFYNNSNIAAVRLRKPEVVISQSSIDISCRNLVCS